MRSRIAWLSLLSLVAFDLGPWAGGLARAAREEADVSASELADEPGLSRGVESLIAEIRKREFSLQRRDREVEQRELAVAELEQIIEQRLDELERIRREIERRIEDWSGREGDRTARLAKVYSSMPAQRAAELLAEMDLDESVEVIRKMKQKPSAAALAAMRSARALEISHRLLEPLNPETDEEEGSRDR